MKLLKISDVCELNPPTVIDKKLVETISFLPMSSVLSNGRVDYSETVSTDKIKNYSVFQNDDVLMAKITPCMENGKGAVVNNLLNGYGAGSTEFIVLRPNQSIVIPQWIYYFLSQTSLRRECVHHMTGSAGQKRLPKKYLGSISLYIPSLSEQERIVARIEELFSELDKAVETLRKTKQQLAVCRQAVLQEAFNGKWQTDTLENLCEFITKGTTPAKQKMSADMGEVPFIKVYNLTFSTKLDFTIEPTFITKETHKGFLSRSITLPGDVLMNIVGPPMGKVSVVPDTYAEWNINQAIARFRCKEKLYNKYLAYYLTFAKTVESMKRKSKATAGQFNLTLEICRNTQIPVPPISEQRRLVLQIESRLSACDRIEQTVNTALAQAEAMRQSILKKAFEGELV